MTRYINHLVLECTTIDQNGIVLGYDDFDPFGNVLPTRSSNFATPNDENKFTGHERDTEGGINLDYMIWRLYDGEIGKFYSTDPHHYSYPSWSPYTYAYNNPLIYTDPDGRDPAALYGALLGAGVEITAQLISNGGDVSKLDKSDIVIATVAGGLSHGIGPVATTAKATAKVLANAAKGLTISMVEGFLKNFTGSESQSLTVDNVIDNTVDDVISGVLGESFGLAGEAIAAGSKGGKELAKKLKKETQSATNNPGSNRLKNNQSKAQSALDSHIETGKDVGSLVGSTTGDAINSVRGWSSTTANNTNTTQKSSSTQADNTRVVNRRQ